MGLAEQRKKQRLVGSATTRNHAWVNDASLPGQRLMASMGWAPGSGLGTSGQGMATNLTVAMKLDNKGIGAHRHEKEAREQNKPDAWIGAGGDLGSLFERLNSANSSEQVSPASPASPAPPAAVAPASVPAVSRLAYVSSYSHSHRAKFRRAKAMVGTDASRMNEILGISSAESSARNSPAPAPESRVSPATSAAPKPTKRGREDSEEDASETPEPAVSKKSKKKDKKASEGSTKAERKLQKAQAKEERKREKREKREKKAAKKADAAQGAEPTDRRPKDKSKKKGKKSSRASSDDESESTSADQAEAPTDTVMEESNLIVSPGGQFVFQYLSNKLMRRRAEVQLRRREAGKWW